MYFFNLVNNFGLPKTEEHCSVMWTLQWRLFFFIHVEQVGGKHYNTVVLAALQFNSVVKNDAHIAFLHQRQYVYSQLFLVT